MAYKRLLLFTILLAICYLVGVTWAETAAQQNVANTGSITAAQQQIKDATVHNNVSATNTDSNNKSAAAAAAASSPLTNVNKIVSNVAAASPNNTTPNNCVCDGLSGKELDNCPQCKCRHEARNTTLIKVVVIIVIWIISILVIYMLFLMCLDPLLNKRVKANYQEHTNEDDDTTSASPPLPTTTNQELSARANVLNRVGHQQDKWKRQVREQRRHIYDRRTMLN